MLSKAELARRAGISALTIDRIEAGMACRLDTKRKIILRLGLKLSQRPERVFGLRRDNATRNGPRRLRRWPSENWHSDLDIGSSSVKLAQLKETKRGYSARCLRPAPLPPEAIVDGALMNSTAIVDAIQELVARDRSSRHKDVAIGVSGHSVIIKKISAAADDPGGARRVDPVGGRAVHPVRRQGREHRHPDPQRRRGRRRARWTCCWSPRRRT